MSFLGQAVNTVLVSIVIKYYDEKKLLKALPDKKICINKINRISFANFFSKSNENK
jgi:hypothetical protein